MLKNDVTSIFMFTYRSIILRMFQVEMPLVHASTPRRLLPSTKYLFTITSDFKYTLLSFLRTMDTSTWLFNLYVLLGQRPISSRINYSLPAIFRDINMINSLFLIASHSIVVHMLESRTSAYMHVMTIFVHYQLLSRRALNWTHFLYFDISYHIA